MQKKEYDFIVVGQGIAGTLLTYFLQKENKKVLVIDEGLEITSSKVAAGIYNPIVFKRLVKSWRADELIPFLEKFYLEFETEFDCKVLFKKNIVKLFSTQLEKDFWIKKQSAQQGISFLGEAHDATYSNQIIDAGFGFAKVEHSGNIEVKTMLRVFRDFLKKHENLAEQKFNYNDLVLENDKVFWKNYSTSCIVFCEGYKMQQNPFAPPNALKPVKGDVLTIETDNYNSTDIVNKNAFVLPMSNSQYKIGSTYNWQTINEEITSEAATQILNKFEQISKTNYTLIKHEAGVRPSSFDRRPILGKHPKHKNIAFFNGLGTKGVIIGPFFAKHLAKHLIFNAEIDVEVDVNRFFK